jgi:hypothetical protein
MIRKNLGEGSRRKEMNILGDKVLWLRMYEGKKEKFRRV